EPVAVAVDGEIVGALPPGTNRGEFPLRAAARRDVNVELRLATFVARDHRQLGAYLDHIAIEHGRGGVPSPGLFAVLVRAPLLVLAAARLGGLGVGAAASAALASLVAQSTLLFPLGLLRSGYAPRLTLLVALGALASALFARWRGARAGEAAAAPAFLAF